MRSTRDEWGGEEGGSLPFNSILAGSPVTPASLTQLQVDVSRRDTERVATRMFKKKQFITSQFKVLL